MAGCGRLFIPLRPVNFFNSRCWFINSSQYISTRAKKFMEESGLPQKPQKPLTPFFRYLKIMRPVVVNEFPQCRCTEIVKKISEKWALETSDYKLKLHEEYDREYKAYIKKIADYENSLTSEHREKLLVIRDKIQKEVNKAKLKHNLQQHGKPKKPPSAFFLYTSEHMKARKDNISNAEYIKNLSAQWKNISEQDKKPYLTQAAELMKKYIQEKIMWEKKMIDEDKNLMNHVNENDLLKLDESSKNPALAHHSSTGKNVVQSRINVTAEGDGKYITKSNEEDKRKSGFYMKTFKKVIKNSDILKEHM